MKQKASELICPKHLKKILYINIQESCPITERPQCQNCYIAGASLHINQVDKLIQQFCQNNETIKVMIQLRNSLMNSVNQFRKCLEEVSWEIENQIQQLNTNQMQQQIAQWYEDSGELRLVDFQKLAEIISKNIVKIEDQFHIKQPLVKDVQVQPIKKKIGEIDKICQELTKLLPQIEVTQVQTKINPPYEIASSLESIKRQVNQIVLNESGMVLAIAMDGVNDNLMVCLIENLKIQQKAYLQGHSNNVKCIQFKNDFLFSGSSDNTIRIWYNMNCIEILSGHTWVVVSLAIAQQQVASGSLDKTVRIWSLDKDAKWQCNQILKQHTHTVQCVEFNQNCTLLVSGSRDKTIVVYRPVGEVWQPIQTLLDHNNVINILKIYKNTIISYGGDNKIRFWKWIKESFQCTQIAEINDIQSIAITNEIMASGSKELMIWSQQNDESWGVYQTIPLKMENLSFSSELLIGISNEKIQILWPK